MQDRSSQRCPACGTEAPVPSRLCSYCGSVLPPAAQTPKQEDFPASEPEEEEPIFIPTSNRSFQVADGRTFTPPKSVKTSPLPLDWLEQTMQSEPPRSPKAPPS